MPEYNGKYGAFKNKTGVPILLSYFTALIQLAVNNIKKDKVNHIKALEKFKKVSGGGDK